MHHGRGQTQRLGEHEAEAFGRGEEASPKAAGGSPGHGAGRSATDVPSASEGSSGQGIREEQGDVGGSPEDRARRRAMEQVSAACCLCSEPAIWLHPGGARLKSMGWGQEELPSPALQLCQAVITVSAMLRSSAAPTRGCPMLRQHTIPPHGLSPALQLGGTDRIPPGASTFLDKEAVLRRQEGRP